MKQRMLQVITSILLIITLTMANFLLLCVDVVSYAADTINLAKNTNHKNIEFMAYFKDENGNKIEEKDTYANSEDLKLYFQISVKQEGYFNGNILLNDANFKIKPDVLSDGINKIEGNTIYLNQINAGESKDLEVGIELLKNEEFDLNYIDMESKISVEGTYRDSTQKDISIKAERKITLNLVNPYKTVDENVVLAQEVITNKILRFNGEDKRIIQLKVKSGVNNNLYPIKNSVINIQTPKISDIYPENVLVNSNDILATNGKMLSQDNWNYNNETGLVTVNIDNTKENNKVSWIKDKKDNIIITYIFDKNVEINNNDIVAKSAISFYDTNNTVLESSNSIILNKEEKDSTVTTNINQIESNIYKGKLYAGISRDITYKNTINVNLNNIASEINITEKNQLIGKEKLNAVYKVTKINKSNVENILGENGKIKIINAENESEISTINKDTEADGDGNIVVTYPENVEKINIKLIEPENIGKLELINTKKINSIDKNIVTNANSINFDFEYGYISNNNENILGTVESNIDLNETETSVDLQINRTELSAMTSNNNVEFRVVLNSKDEKNTLFKNPTLKLKLPEKIDDVKVNSIKLLYEDELKIKSATLNGKTIDIALDGEQTQYKEEAIDGAIIIINADLTTSKKITNSTEHIELEYMNNNNIGNAIQGICQKDINIVSYAGVVTTNYINEYAIDVVNNEGVKSGELEVSADAKTANIEKRIINNKENKISDIKILGVFPTKDATDENNIDIEVGNILVNGIDSSRVKVYYSNNSMATEDLDNKENNWVENIDDNKDVKKYLVVVNEFDLLEEIDLSYSITIPSNLEYNKCAKEGYTVFYKNMSIEEKVQEDYIKLSTPRGTVLETTLKGLVSGEESNQVKENEVLRYAVVVSNTGSDDVSNVKVTSKIPDGTTYVNTDELNNQTDVEQLNFEDSDKKEVEFNIDQIPEGEKVVKYYEVKVNEGMAEKEINNKVTTQYGDVVKTSNEVKTSVSDGDLELKLISVDADDGIVKSGYGYRYVLYVTNKSNKDIKNVKTTVNTSNILNISEIYYIDSENHANMVENTNSIDIDKILSGETIEVSIYTTVSIFNDETSKDVSITANSVVNDKKYTSNEINLKAKSNLLLSMDVTSENSGNYVKTGDTLVYKIIIKNNGEDVANIVTLNNWISNDITLTKVTRNGLELSNEDYSLTVDSAKDQKLLKLQESSIEPGNSVEYKIEAVVNLLYGIKNATEIINDYSLNVDSLEIATSKIEHILQPEIINQDEENEDDNNNNNSENSNSNNGSSNSEQQDSNNYKIISGVAWLDENENGQRETNEKTIDGIIVKLLDTTTNEFVKDSNGDILSTKTSDTGFYSFSKITKGKYLVIFEYDNTQYGLTSFEKDGVSDELNSNVITKNINVEGQESKVAATEILNVDNSNISNINIGLIFAKKYDLQLNKYISKVTVQNSKTVTNTYTDATLVKQEIDAKQVNATTVIVEYTIKVTNNGDVTAYVKKIADYLSSDYKFSSELNKDWYQSGNDVYCTSLANEKIEPGESKEVKLIVVKDMKENNTGLINNTAEIVNSYNELGLTDINSTEGNKAKGEDDMGSADLIISIKTGQVITTVSLIISTIVILGVAVILTQKLIINKRLI